MEPDADTDTDLREGAVLFADVSGSSALYKLRGEQAALSAIRRFQQALTEVALRHDGVFVKSSGDDVLCRFDRCDDAVRAAREMLQLTGEGMLTVHAGLEWGAFVCEPGDVFGDCVNAASELCDLAKRRELLVGELCFRQLERAQRAAFVPIPPMHLKGRTEASGLFSLRVHESDDQTSIDELGPVVVSAWDAVVYYGGQQWRVVEGEPLTVGRHTDNRVHVPVRNVSREHATVRLSNGIVEYEDHSSFGSAVMQQSGEALAVSRRKVPLSGAGKVYLGVQQADPSAPCLQFDVMRR